ncbi:MAG: N-acetylmuramoyl-L-alanine amidase [Desulfovibrio sp.]|jgi:N-acetylmuramoyl-L-alanine amidase|nr:N-acetylmuramoyl-L-alanine amidase [Desulfovibrio sp.]
MERLGLGVHTIMLDPGHGGKDPGCLANKLVEKDFTLDMAKRIGALLEKKGFAVLYTRSGDTFISLADRPDLANKERADLFISLHLNANPDASVRGLETYYLSEARTGDAAKVAARENGVSLQNISDLQVILTDLMLSAKLKESRSLARCVQQAVLGGLREAGLSIGNGGVRSAPFYVLMGTRMPAVLVEFGYATNAREAANLLSEKFLQRQAEGVVNGILAYKEQLAKSMR